MGYSVCLKSMITLHRQWISLKDVCVQGVMLNSESIMKQCLRKGPNHQRNLYFWAMYQCAYPRILPLGITVQNCNDGMKDHDLWQPASIAKISVKLYLWIVLCSHFVKNCRMFIVHIFVSPLNRFFVDIGSSPQTNKSAHEILILLSWNILNPLVSLKYAD